MRVITKIIVFIKFNILFEQTIISKWLSLLENFINLSIVLWNLLAFRPKIVYSYVIGVADSESNIGLHSSALVLEIQLFLRIRKVKSPSAACIMHQKRKISYSCMHCVYCIVIGKARKIHSYQIS